MRGIMADVCGKEEGAERRLRHAHVNGSLMKQYDRCIIEILPHPPLFLDAYLSRLAIRVSVFPRYFTPRSSTPTSRRLNVSLFPDGKFEQFSCA